MPETRSSQPESQLRQDTGSQNSIRDLLNRMYHLETNLSQLQSSFNDHKATTNLQALGTPYDDTELRALQVRVTMLAAHINTVNQARLDLEMMMSEERIYPFNNAGVDQSRQEEQGINETD